MCPRAGVEASARANDWNGVAMPDYTFPASW
jgi:hypothetical protein